MQAVVLMAGEGTRMARHYEGPKQLLPVCGRPVVEHMLDNLPVEVSELYFVVGGPHERRIREYFESGEYGGKPITFVVQEEQLGLAHAYSKVEGLVRGRWLGINGDDIYGRMDLAELVKYDLAVLAYRVEHPESFGVLVVDGEGYLERSVEKPKKFISDLVSTGAMVMDESFFEVKLEPSARGEYETPDAWMKLIEEKGKRIKIVEARLWLPVNDKRQLEEAERMMSGKGGSR